MPTLFARRYHRNIENVSRAERTCGVVILGVLAAIVVVFIVQVVTNDDFLFTVDQHSYRADSSQRTETAAGGAGAPHELAGDRKSSAKMPVKPFPDPGLDGWRAPRRAAHFTADSLYQKINGRAEAYIQFHVVGLTFGSYRKADDPKVRIDVYLYDMGEPANAFGIYRAEAAPGAKSLNFGHAGYAVGGAIFFCKGASYVQVSPSHLDERAADAALHIARQIATMIPDVPLDTPADAAHEDQASSE